MIGFLSGYIYSLYRDKKVFPGDEALLLNEKPIDFFIKKRKIFFTFSVLFVAFSFGALLYSLLFEEHAIVLVLFRSVIALVVALILLFGSFEDYNADCVIVDGVLYIKVLRTRYRWLEIPLADITGFGVYGRGSSMYIQQGKKRYSLVLIANRTELTDFLRAHGVKGGG
ncbi:hypothetical protein [Desulfovibrio inopinatus]|uniref:hypothetical protein n=1 Tax=Desulfovibrio inopinatus TaxID=102109 RepID=UPI000402EDF4|nr:hypothetical protein [Desulfovibrio inopinatus]